MPAHLTSKSHARKLSLVIPAAPAAIILAIAAGLRIAQGVRLPVQGILSLAVQIADLPLKLVGPGQERLVKFRGDVDGHAGGLIVLAGLPAEAHVDRQGHAKSPCPIRVVKVRREHGRIGRG
jgi:hypothetical protein